MERKIKSVSEAYSMQPNFKFVAYGNKYKFEVGECPLVEIKEQGDYYNDFDKDGNLLFSWIVKTVNVEYFAVGEWSELIIKDNDNLPI
jgi:hypothetical protein